MSNFVFVCCCLKNFFEFFVGRVDFETVERQLDTEVLKTFERHSLKTENKVLISPTMKFPLRTVDYCQ